MRTLQTCIRMGSMLVLSTSQAIVSMRSMLGNITFQCFGAIRMRMLFYRTNQLAVTAGTVGVHIQATLTITFKVDRVVVSRIVYVDNSGTVALNYDILVGEGIVVGKILLFIHRFAVDLCVGDGCRNIIPTAYYRA